MSGDASAYAALGLEPGADQAAVELAYRQLIKRYHPDRAGGDPARAAEINSAYYQLRQLFFPPDDRAPSVDLAEAIYAQRLARRRRVVPPARRLRTWPLLAVALCSVAYVQRDPLLTLIADSRAYMADAIKTGRREEAQTLNSTAELRFDGPLNLLSVDSAIKRAAAGSRMDRDALLAESRTCHRGLRAGPTLARLDACAAFDNAVLEIQNRGIIQEDGPFAASAVTARQMAAAKLLSRDYQAIEERLDRLRSYVQLQLARPDAAPLPPSSVTEPATGTAGSLPPLMSRANRPAAH